ncbi:HTH-type transcriptional repressor ComR [compost metagenome]
MEVFWELGYEAASLAALTEAMDIPPPSLYAAFGSKEGLFREALTHYLCKHGGYRQELLDNAATAREAIEGLLRETVEHFYSGNTSTGCLVVLTALTGAPESAPVRASLAAERATSTRMFHKRLERGVRDGDLAADTPIESLANYYGTVLFGLSIQAHDQMPKEQLLEVVELAMRAFPHGR